jgi:hypothetical protein
MQKLFGLSDICRALNASENQVVYVLRSRKHIQPIMRVGVNRLFDLRAVKLIEAELRAMRD